MSSRTRQSPANQRNKAPDNSRTLRPCRNRLPNHLKPGSAVEISSDDPDFRGSWYPGTVVAATSADSKDFPVNYQVEYTTLFFDKGRKKRMREVVNVSQLRPPAPPVSESEKRKEITVGKEVEAYYEEGWWEGEVTEVSKDDKFSVFFRTFKKQIVFNRDEIRFHREWVDGAWKPSLEEEEEDTDDEEIFSSGTLVEVSSDEEGFKGSWFVAKVIERIGEEDKYVVEYRDLREENGVETLKEEASFLHIRPLPPSEEDIDFVVGDKIDAFHNDGWWVGFVVESMQDGRVGVYFKHSREKMRFGRQGLRLHKEWINGTWQIPSKGRETKRAKVLPCKRNVKPKKATEKQEFCNGTLVEVSSKEEGFEDSWFPAKLIVYRGSEKCFVEYDNLKAEDGKEPLREEVSVSLIRPKPLERIMVYAFEKLDKVDALYNDGWWVGEITKVLAMSSYLVYFKKTREVLKFHHSQLRLHQEWCNGKWLT
ncbi:unnamed protein product [Cochlearia groenlandica]